MADIAQTTIAAGVTLTSGLDSLTEHGQIKVLADGTYLIECEQNTGVWVPLYRGSDPIMVFDYVGDTVRITNDTPDGSTLNIRIGQV